MAKPVAVVTDSTSYIPQELREKYNISVVPLLVIWDGVTYRDGIDITPEEFYPRLATSKTLPTSSQASLKDFMETFSRLLDEGYDILTVVISSRLSGTIKVAEQAKRELGADNIEIVDSLSTAMQLGFQTLTGARAAADGASLAEAKALVEKARENSGFLLTVKTLEFLHRGGRIGGASRLLGTALGIKPILEVRDGRVEPLEKVRTQRRALKRMIEIAVERTRGRHPIHLAIGHINAEEKAREVMEQIIPMLEPEEVLFTTVSPVVGTHVGPGGIGIAYMTGV